MPLPRNQSRVLLPYSQMITSRVTSPSADANAAQLSSMASASTRARIFFMSDSLHIIYISPVPPAIGNKTQRFNLFISIALTTFFVKLFLYNLHSVSVARRKT